MDKILKHVKTKMKDRGFTTRKRPTDLVPSDEILDIAETLNMSYDSLLNSIGILRTRKKMKLIDKEEVIEVNPVYCLTASAQMIQEVITLVHMLGIESEIENLVLDKDTTNNL
jgi:hypothetical protein